MDNLLNNEDLKTLEYWIANEIRYLEDENSLAQGDINRPYGVDECRLTLKAIQQLALSYNEQFLKKS